MEQQVVDLKSLSAGQVVTGLVYIQSYSKKLDKTSKAPLNGTLYYKGKTVGFKVWAGVLQNSFNDNDLAGKVMFINGKADMYRDNLEITLDSGVLSQEAVDPTMFFKSVDVNALFAKLNAFVTANMTPNGQSLVKEVFANQELLNGFAYTWAGKKMHDAQTGGLMNHTLKMMNIAKALVDNDERLATPEWKDLLYIGILFHDIGKIYEIKQGGDYTDISFITHRSLGMEIMYPYKSSIIRLYDEKFYYQLLAIIQGHHGEYGDAPTTVWAYIIHLIDMLECNITGFLDRHENGESGFKNGNDTMWMNGGQLVY